MTKVSAYIRVSTDLQTDGLGLQIQKDSILKYLNSRPNYQLTKIYEDPGYSGAGIDRPGLSELLTDAKEHKFNKIIVARLDRLSRDLYTALWLEKELLLHDVTVESVSEPFRENDPISTAMRQIIHVFAQLEKERIKERMLSGRMRKLQNGDYSGGAPATGYKTEKGKLVINEKEVEILRRIYGLRIRRKSYNAIAAILNKEGIPSKHGKLFYANTIHYILKNPVYKGIIRYGKVVKGNHEKIMFWKKGI
ncbi:MAG: recombinase family protein [bacterium]